MDLRDFLGEKYGDDTEHESGSFTLALPEAVRKTQESLRHQPYSFVLHLVRASHEAGSKLDVRTQRPFLTPYLLNPPDLEFRLEEVGLSKCDLEQLETSLVATEKLALSCVARAFYQAQYIKSGKVVLESWQDGKIQRLSWKKGKPALKTVKARKNGFRGLRFLLWDSRGSLDLSISKCLDWGKRAARWSPVKFSLNGTDQGPETRVQHGFAALYWECPDFPICTGSPPDKRSLGRYSLFGFVEDKRTDTSFYALVDGLCFQLPRQALFRAEELDLPGLTLVIHSPEFRLDASGIRLVENFKDQEWVKGARSAAAELRRALLRNDAARLYLLRHWDKFGTEKLSEKRLFRLRSGESLSYSELKRVIDREGFELHRELQPDDASFAEQLLSSREPYRFTSGYEFPKHAIISADGCWVALLTGTRCQVLSLENRDKVLWLDFAPSSLGDDACWHPVQPWLLLARRLEVAVWDLTTGLKIFSHASGGSLAPAFSADGSQIQVCRQNEREFSLHRWRVEDWKALSAEFTVNGVPRVVGDFLVVFDLYRLSIRPYSQPDRILAEFPLQKVPYTVCDVSPSKRYAALDDGQILYLLDLDALTLDVVADLRISSRSKKAQSRPLFSWRGDYLFYCYEEGCVAYHLGRKSADRHLEGYTSYSRCGHTFRFRQIPRSVNFIRDQVDVLVEHPQSPPPGVANRTVHLVEDYNAWTALVLEADVPSILWDFSKLEFSLMESSFSFRGHFTVESLDLRCGEWRSGEESHLWGRAIWDRYRTFMEPHTLKPAAKLPALSHPKKVALTEAAPVYQVSTTEEGQTILVELESGKVSWSEMSGVVQCNRDFLLSRDEGGRWSTGNRLTGRQGSFHQGISSVCLHPIGDRILSCDDWSTSLAAYLKDGSGRHMQQIEGVSPAYSPSGQFIAVNHQETVIICTDFLVRVGHLVSGKLQPNQWNWLTDRAIRVKGDIWIADPVHGWKKPALMEARLPAFMQTHNRSNLGLASVHGQIHFFCLATGLRVGVFHQTLGGFFFYTPDGRWEAACDYCLEFVQPAPMGSATPGLLASVFGITE